MYSKAPRPIALVIDDQPSEALALCELLAGACDAHATHSGAAAVAACRTATPDVIVLSASLRDMDAYELCRHLKGDAATRDVPVIFVGNGGSPEDEARALDEGGADFLARPVVKLVARARVRNALAVKSQAQALRSFATTDWLTELANRRRFEEALAQEWRRAYRERTILALLMLDVDHFKSFNDRYGHPAGDACLRAIASTLRGVGRRPADLPARFGGEEFVLLLPGAAETFATATAEVLRRAVEALAIPHVGADGCSGVVTVSVGVATGDPRRPGEPEQLVAAADRMLYEAKRLGRNRVVSAGCMPAEPGAPPTSDEAERIAAVTAISGALRRDGRSAYLDDVARLAAKLLDTPIGLISLVGRDDQIFVGRYGLDLDGTPRDISFCSHAIGGDEPLIVNDATGDRRFSANPLVTGELGIRFYAGAPLKSTHDGPTLGALCVIDQASRPTVSPDQIAQLALLATLAMGYIEAQFATEVQPAAP